MKTRQDKTRQDKTRQDKTRQDKTRQDKTRIDNGIIDRRSGFSLVELLAVIVILGLLMALAISSVSRLISKSKDENNDSHKKTLIMAAESYLQDHKEKMPKDIGDKTLVKAKELKDTNYLKEDIYNADKKSCMKDSVVRVYKYDTKSYNYTAHIYCEGDKVPSEIKGIEPVIKITFTDQKGNPYNISKDNVTTAVTKIQIDGGKNGKKDITLDGYSYIISVQYDNKDSLTEIYNSGSLNAGGKKTINIEKDITEFLDRSRLSYIVVTVEAYNHDGGYKKLRADSRYQDSKKPVCGATTGEPAEDEWNKDWRTKRITIKCSDGSGSGCVKGSFTKTFTKEAEYGTITIKDNAGNTTDCKVRVHLDWTRPTLTINAYKRLSTGDKGAKVGTAKVNNSTSTIDLNKYTGTFPTSNGVVSNGTGNWLNQKNYPYGVYYEVITEDNIKLGKGTWSENAKMLQKNDSRVTTVTAQSGKGTKKFTKGDNKTNFSLVDEGYRYGTYVLKDKALNTVTIKITAPIDRTAPTIPTVSLYKKNSGTDISNSSGLGGYTNGQWIHGWVFTKASNSTDAVSLFDHYELTTTGKTTNVSNYSQSYRNINREGTSYVKYRAMDKAGNYSNYTGNSTIKLDRTAPACTNIAKVNSSGSRNYSSGSWLSGNVYTAATCSESGDVSGCSGTRKVTTSGATGNRNRAATGSYTVTQEGTSYTTWYTYDNVGNEKSCSTVTEKIDKTPPTCTNSGGMDWTRNNITITGNCTDAISGCVKNKVSRTYSAPIYNSETESPGIVKDNAGNTTACKNDRIVKIDKVAPTCGNITGSSTTWTNQNRTVNVGCNDVGSGCRKKVYTKIYTSDRKTSRVLLYDKAGNTASCSVNVYIDKTPPYTPIIHWDAFHQIKGVSIQSGRYGDCINNKGCVPDNNYSMTLKNSGTQCFIERQCDTNETSKITTTRNCTYRKIYGCGEPWPVVTAGDEGGSGVKGLTNVVVDKLCPFVTPIGEHFYAVWGWAYYSVDNAGNKSKPLYLWELMDDIYNQRLGEYFYVTNGTWELKPGKSCPGNP